jgi:HEPN domain-containing protein
LPFNVESAGKFYSDANDAILEAREKFKKYDWAIAVKSAQLCIELSVKGMLKLFDIEYPPNHDVSEKLELVLKKVQGIPDHVVEAIARAKMASRIWEPVHSISDYGELGISSRKLFKEIDAKAATECANDANICLFWLLDLTRSGELKLR